MYGDEIDLAYFDGIHPMAHAGSKQDAKTKLGEKQKLSAVRQKEGHLAILWLSERLKATSPDLEHCLVVAKPESESTEDQHCCLLKKDEISYKLIDKLLKADKKPSISIKKNRRELKKRRLLHKTIIPTFKARFETLDCLLSPGNIQQSVIIQSDITDTPRASHQKEIESVPDQLISDLDKAIFASQRSINKILIEDDQKDVE